MIWMGQKLHPDAPLYNMAITFFIDAPIQATLFSHAFTTLLTKSDALRTVIRETDGVPQSVILETPPIELLQLDFSQEENPDGALQRWIDKRTRQKLVLEDSLLDSALIKLSDRKFAWYLNQHHLINDGWTAAIVYRRMAEFYKLALADNLQSAPELPAYADYAIYEEKQRHPEKHSKIRVYWEKKAAKSIEPPAFYGESPRESTTAGERINCDFGRERSEKLREIARRKDVQLLYEDISLFNIFAALLTALLYRISGQTEHTIGAPSHNRPSAAFKETIGLFIELFPLHMTIDANESFLSLVRKINREKMDFLRNAGPGMSTPELNSTIPVVLNFINSSFSDFNGAAISSQWHFPGHGDAGHSLRLLVHDLDQTGSFQLCFEFNDGAFTPAQREMTIAYFFKLADAFLDYDQQPIGKVPLLSSQDEKALAAYNQTDFQYPAQETLVDMLEARAKATPNANALSFEDQTLNYRILNERVNQLANFLRKNGVGKGTVVALCLERSPEMVIAIWAVLKSGGAFLPIEPDYPPDRIRFLLKDTAAPFLLTLAHQEDNLKKISSTENSSSPLSPVDSSEATDVSIISLDSDWEKIRQESSKNPQSEIAGSDLAYLIYTSGSTGTPKGVMIEHEAIANYIHWGQRTYFADGPLDFPLFSTFAADLTLTSILLPLVSGSQILIYGEENDGLDLAIRKVFQDGKAGIIKLTPSHLAVIEASDIYSPNLKKLILGGEDLKSHLAKKISDIFSGDIEIYNEYGPTEATIGCMIHRFDPASDLQSSVPIGRPVDNMRIYLLDEQDNPTLPGVPGEMYIAGKGLARGYWNQPQLSEERFLPDPFYPGERMYRTGDLARWSAPQVMTYLGRKDAQVKVRGFRIELGEIETALLAHTKVHDCVVDLSEYLDSTEKRPRSKDETFLLPQQTEKQLAAYYTGPAALKSADLRRFLSGKLPAYMIPAHFIYLKTLPLTDSGKIDRKQLPKLSPEKTANSTADFIAPANEREALLAKIWADVLRIDQVGRKDNFFDLGGDSILNIQIVARARQAGLQFTPAQLFKHPTIAALAKVAALKSAATAEQGKVQGSAPLTPIQHWFFQHNFENVHHWNMSIFLTFAAAVDAQILEKALLAVINHHDVLRLRFRQEEGQWQQSFSPTPESTLNFQQYDLTGLSQESYDERIAQEKMKAAGSLNIKSGPLLNAVLFKGESNQLFLTLHHLVVDGVSWQIFLEDLQQAYSAIEDGQPVRLAQKTDSYQRWANALKAYAHSPALQKDDNYWQQVLKAKAAQLQLDSNSPAENTEGSADTVIMHLSKKETSNLLQNAPAAHHATANDLLITALAQCLNKLPGEHPFCIDLEGHGRENLSGDIDVTRTIGWFTAIFPFSLALAAPSNFTESIVEIKDRLRQIPGRGATYGIYQYLRPGNNDLAHVPPAQILFNYLGQTDQLVANMSLFSSDYHLSAGRHPNGLRSHIWEIYALVRQHRLELHWVYSKALHSKNTIEQLANAFLKNLQSLIDHCLSSEAASVTASDFPLAKLNKKKLNKLAKLLGD